MQVSAIKHWDELSRIARFGAVGLSGAFIYAMLVLALVRGVGLAPVMASGTAFAIGIPYSYLGQKYFTFRSGGNAARQFSQVILLHGFNWVLAMAITYCVVVFLGLSDAVGILAVVASVAISSYSFMKLGIFRQTAIK